ncbi:U11/U12 small nuclear ribonucleoprotein 35 kDa protein-like [Neocloeon triangulifer]|uniref:U11/U12 small nuclear ribonucleoprotein 35 kDa protein-like n=1 Tax=Neocloeon triangulifer TaxID=2078957 RepID=UPI00286F221F|nr:U11/U12 small nuclear ribonucleoprotein 35 kDa protein-like [Neocloeon triangulifer]
MQSSKSKPWSPYATEYNPLEAGSIDATDTEPHDNAIARAMEAHYTPNPTLRSKPEYTVFIARLNFGTSESTLRRAFSEYGEILNCTLVRDIVTGASKGYAFVEYRSRSSVELACRRGNKTELDGRILFVDREIGRTMKGWIPRRLGGGFGGNKNSGQLRFGGKDKPYLKPITKGEEKEEKRHHSKLERR